MEELIDIQRKIIDLNYEMSLAMRYNDSDKIVNLRKETNDLITLYLDKIDNKQDNIIYKK